MFGGIIGSPVNSCFLNAICNKNATISTEKDYKITVRYMANDCHSTSNLEELSGFAIAIAK